MNLLTWSSGPLSVFPVSLSPMPLRTFSVRQLSYAALVFVLIPFGLPTIDAKAQNPFDTRPEVPLAPGEIQDRKIADLSRRVGQMKSEIDHLNRELETKSETPQQFDWSLARRTGSGNPAIGFSAHSRGRSQKFRYLKKSFSG